MKKGKIGETQLERSVFKNIHHHRKEILAGPKVGGDYAAFSVGEDVVVTSMASSSLAGGYNALLALHTALNNVVCSGGNPVGVEVGILLPAKTREIAIKRIMQQIENECEKYNIEVIGGSTQISTAVTEIIVTVTAYAAIEGNIEFSADNILAGQEIVMTKTIAKTGCGIIANQKKDELEKRYPSTFIEGTMEFEQDLSIINDVLVAKANNATYLHDVNEGGIFRGLWELGEVAGRGLEVDLKSIAVQQETIEICDYVDANPYKLMSCGNLLIVTSNGKAMTQAFLEKGIKATVIGRFTDDNDKVIINDGERRFLESCVEDEIFGTLLEVEYER